MRTAEQVVSVLLEDQERIDEGALDAIQAALDIAGLSPELFGTGADAANVAISLLRAAKAKDKDAKHRHLINAGISAISLVPFADAVKLLKSKTARGVASKVVDVVKGGARAYPKSYRDKQQPPRL